MTSVVSVISNVRFFMRYHCLISLMRMGNGGKSEGKRRGREEEEGAGEEEEREG